MPEEFKVGCEQPDIKQPEAQVSTAKISMVEEEKKSMIKVGKPAPDFKASAFYKGKFMSTSLSDYKGKWVVLCFYPGDFTFVGATEVSAVAEMNPEFEKLGVQVLSMSVDSVYVHKIWNDHELSKMIGKDIPFPMLSDQDGKIGKMYGIYDEDSGVETRGRFIIDPDGIVRGFEVLTPPVGRNVSETIRQIQAFQLVRDTKGAEVAPAGWKPGKNTLKPSRDLVGNVWKVWKVSEAFDDAPSAKEGLWCPVTGPFIVFPIEVLVGKRKRGFRKIVLILIIAILSRHLFLGTKLRPWRSLPDLSFAN